MNIWTNEEIYREEMTEVLKSERDSGNSSNEGPNKWQKINESKKLK
jgi:hypothetical protein